MEAGRLDERRWRPIPIAAERPLTVYRNIAVLPRYRLGSNIRLATNMEEARRLLSSVDPRLTAIVEGSIPGVAGSGRVEVVSYAPERVVLQVECDGPSFLLAADGFAAGWKASVDGAASVVYPA